MTPAAKLLCGLLAIVLTGCDGLVTVTGVIVDRRAQPVDDCLIELYDAGTNEPTGAHRQVSVSRRFTASFLIAPTASDYFFRITCRSIESSYDTEVLRFGGAHHAETPLDLGAIALE